MSDAALPEIKQTPAGASLSVRAQPRAGRDAFDGIVDGALKVRLRAPPVDGAANAALLKFLGRQLKVPPSSLRVASGQSSRNKRVVFSTLDAQTLRARLRERL